MLRCDTKNTLMQEKETLWKIVAEQFMMKWKGFGLCVIHGFKRNHSTVRDFYVIITWNLAELLVFSNCPVQPLTI